MKIFYLSQVDLNKHYSGSVHVKEVVKEIIGLNNEVWLFAQAADPIMEQKGRLQIKALGKVRGGTKAYFFFQWKLLVSAFFMAIKVRPDFFYVRSESAMFAHIIISKILGVPYFLELNNWPFRDFENVRNVPSLVRKIVTSIIGWSINGSRGIVCVTEKIGHKIREKYKRAEGVFDVENGVNTDLFKPVSAKSTRIKLGLEKTDYVLGFVAYYQYYNDAEIAVRAVSQLKNTIPGIKLVLVGGWAQKEHRDKIEILISEIAQDSVILTGEVSYNDMPEYIACFDVSLALFNTDVGDGSVMKVYEYLSCSKPVIGSEISSLEFLVKEKLGVTVPIGDAEALINQIQSFGIDKMVLDEMGLRGRRYVINNRSWKIVVEKIEKHINTSLNKTE